jgi:hypothetical protein
MSPRRFTTAITVLATAVAALTAGNVPAQAISGESSRDSA